MTTHSKLLAGTHRADISRATGIAVERILLLETLSSFDTEQQFTNKIQLVLLYSELYTLTFIKLLFNILT